MLFISLGLTQYFETQRCFTSNVGANRYLNYDHLKRFISCFRSCVSLRYTWTFPIRTIRNGSTWLGIEHTANLAVTKVPQYFPTIPRALSLTLPFCLSEIFDVLSLFPIVAVKHKNHWNIDWLRYLEDHIEKQQNNTARKSMKSAGPTDASE